MQDNGTESTLAQLQAVFEEKERMAAEIDQLTRLTDQLREERDDEKAKNEAFVPYEDIILDDDASKQWKKVSIRSPITTKHIALRARQYYHNERPLTIATVVNAVLDFGTSNAGWRQVVKYKLQKEGTEDGGNA